MQEQTLRRAEVDAARRIFQRPRAEHGFADRETIVKAYVWERGCRGGSVPPLGPSAGHGRADFGEAGGDGDRGRGAVGPFLAVDLQHSDACFAKAFPAEPAEAFCDGHNAAFAFIGGVPRCILYDGQGFTASCIR
jgi:hypothetical protein